MTTITAKMVGDLRAQTGAGMMDCKKALSEAEGDMEQAIDLLRKKGLSAAAKKSGRVAAEGMIAAAGSDHSGALVEVNSETDFVAKNDLFQAFVNGVADVVLNQNPADVEALKALDFPGSGRNVADELSHQIATIGENMNVRRFARLESNSGVTASYIHGAGKIGVLVQLDSDKHADPRVSETARLLAMHVAAANPQYLKRKDVPAEVVEREKDIMRAKALESGKPESIVDKIIEGQINKFFAETCLLEQVYVIDTDQKVGKVVESLAKEIGGEVALSAYVRFQLGEGIEKKEDDFAAEVASMTK
ncbi:MAG: translation elongation factor Ts [Desulfuromonadales bacterium]